MWLAHIIEHLYAGGISSADDLICDGLGQSSACVSGLSNLTIDERFRGVTIITFEPIATIQASHGSKMVVLQSWLRRRAVAFMDHIAPVLLCWIRGNRPVHGIITSNTCCRFLFGLIWNSSPAPCPKIGLGQDSIPDYHRQILSVFRYINRLR